MMELYDLPSIEAYSRMPEDQKRRVAVLVEKNERIIRQEEQKLAMARARISKKAKAQAVAEHKADLREKRDRAKNYPVHPDWFRHRREANAEVEEFNRRKRA
jgi:hypothetical protein